MRNTDIEVGAEYAAKVSFRSGSATEFQMNFGHVKVVEKNIDEPHPRSVSRRITGTRVEMVEKWTLGSASEIEKGRQLVIPNRDFYGPWDEYARQREASKIRGERRSVITRLMRWRDDQIRRKFDDYVAELALSDDTRERIQRGGISTNPGARQMAQFALAAAAGGVDWAQTVNDAIAEIDAEFDRSVDAAKARAIDALTEAGFEIEARDQAGVVAG